MKRVRIFAIGQEPYWFQAVKNAAETCLIDDVHCLSILDEVWSLAQDPDVITLLLVDASGQPEIKSIAKKLGELGWQYVIVVAANLTDGEAHSLFQVARAYDYWQKTYDTTVICSEIERWKRDTKKENS